VRASPAAAGGKHDAEAAGNEQGVCVDAVLWLPAAQSNDTPGSHYSGCDFWLSKLNSSTGTSDAEMVKAFLVSGDTAIASGLRHVKNGRFGLESERL
jgi:hypothetical protein